MQPSSAGCGTCCCCCSARQTEVPRVVHALQHATDQLTYCCCNAPVLLAYRCCTAGTISCFIMERFAPGVNFMLSAELDHAAKNYKFGFGFTAGE